MSRRRSPDAVRQARQRLERELLADLKRARAPLLEETDRLRATGGNRMRREHLCCRRARNQMRITPLEARAIADAFRTVPELRGFLPHVLERLERELRGLEDNSERQNFDCPLLDGTRCLVHRYAKPIGCLAWNPGQEYSKVGWRAFEIRDELNDALHGRSWQLRAIPLWLKRVFRRQLASLRRNAGPPGGAPTAQTGPTEAPQAAEKRPERRSRPPRDKRPTRDKPPARDKGSERSPGRHGRRAQKRRD